MMTRPIVIRGQKRPGEWLPEERAQLNVCDSPNMRGQPCGSEEFVAYTRDGDKYPHLQCVQCGTSYCVAGDCCQVASKG